MALDHGLLAGGKERQRGAVWCRGQASDAGKAVGDDPLFASGDVDGHDVGLEHRVVGCVLCSREVDGLAVSRGSDVPSALGVVGELLRFRATGRYEVDVCGCGGQESMAVAAMTLRDDAARQASFAYQVGPVAVGHEGQVL